MCNNEEGVGEYHEITHGTDKHMKDLMMKHPSKVDLTLISRSAVAEG